MKRHFVIVTHPHCDSEIPFEGIMAMKRWITRHYTRLTAKHTIGDAGQRHRCFAALLAVMAVFLFGSPELPAQKHIVPVPEITKTTLWDVCFSDAQHGIAVGDYGVIQRSVDGGRSWKPKKSKDQLAFRNVHFFGKTQGIACGFWSTMFITDDGGDTWSKVDLHMQNHLPGFAAAGWGCLWASGEKGVVLKSTDRGRSWTKKQTDTQFILDAISFADSLHGWCSSVQGALFYTCDGGDTWQKRLAPSKLPVTTIVARGPKECWLGGFNGLVAASSDAGATWKIKPAYTINIQRMRFDTLGRGWAVGNRGAIIRSADGGETWDLFKLTDAGLINSIHFPDDTTIVAVGSAGTILRIPVPH